MHISVKRNPLALYMEGSRESVEAVEKYVDDIQKVLCCFCIAVLNVLIDQ